MIKITYTKDGVEKNRYALTQYYAQLRREKLSEEGIAWTEEEGVWQETIPEELGAWEEPN